MNKPELLCPVGDLERLQMALHFGADAVYLAGAQFGMRAGAENFTPDGIRAAVQLAHAQGAAVHVTCNTLPRDDEMAQLPAYLEMLDDAGVDAIIAADLGVITLAKRYAPHVALHVSTQFGVVNSAAAAALHDLGAQRVVLARELSLAEIRTIRANTPPELERVVFRPLPAVELPHRARCQPRPLRAALPLEVRSHGGQAPRPGVRYYRGRTGDIYL